MKMAKRRFGIAATVVAVLAIAVVAIEPIRLPESVIRAWLLHEQPMGTSFTVVRAWLEDRRWRDLGNHEQAGLYWQDPGMPTETIGTSSLSAHLGHYLGVPWRVDVEAFWAFDQQGRLIAVKVRKDADSL
jgi:hypothetical protein